MFVRRLVEARKFGSLRFSSVCLKAAILAGLVFLLPLALTSRAVEVRYLAALRSNRFARDRRSASILRIRRLRVFLHFSGISGFSAFLLSGQDMGPLVRSDRTRGRRSLRPALA